jgi:hypothetical protein
VGTNGGGCGGDVLDKGQGVVVGLGGGDSEIEPGVGFDLQNQEPSSTGSVSVWY